MLIHEVEQGTDDWYSLRAGMPTASEASKLVTSKGEPSKSMQGYAQTLAGDLYAGKPIDAWEGNAYTERGKEIEHEARLAYAMRGNEVAEVGFVTDDLKQWGCSPDGLVNDDGMVEIKCLPKQHIKALLYFKKNGKIMSEHIVQPQMQMLVAERQWCDFVYYHPDLPMLVVRQTHNPEIMSGLALQLAACLKERDAVLDTLESF